MYFPKAILKPRYKAMSLLKISTTLSTSLLCFLFLFTSCKKESLNDNIDIIDPTLKNLVLSTGLTDNEISIKSNNWTIAYIKDATTKLPLPIIDDQGLSLPHSAKIELQEGWLQLEKTANNTLSISLKENFTNNPRNFIIGIATDNTVEEMHVVQSRGEQYEVIEKEIIEIEGSRKIYTSNEGCKYITLSNSSSEPKNMETTRVFDGVKYRSSFSSEDSDAFEWINKEQVLLFMDEVLVDGVIVWNCTSSN